jgi:arsenate reductase
VTEKTKVLFVCTGNSARSQMAEGYLRSVAGDRYDPISGGIAPKGINPLAVEAMHEIGIDICAQKSKDIEAVSSMNIPYVVTVCDNAKEQCPILPGTIRSLHWSFEDPASAIGPRERQLEVFRKVRDQIVKRIEEELLNESGVRLTG